MKVIILAAGNGRRLRPLTENIPKCLIELNDKTVLENIIKNCVDTGITDFIIVVGHKNDMLKQRLTNIENSYQINYDIVHNYDYDITNSGVSLGLAFDYIGDNNDDIVIINADTIFDKRILEALVKRNKTAIVIDNKKILTKESFKVKIEGNKIVSMGKDVPIEESTGEFIGLSLIKLNDLKIIKEILKKLIVKNRNQYYSCIYKKFSSIGLVEFISVDNLKWTDIDVIEDLKYAKEIIDDIYI